MRWLHQSFRAKNCPRQPRWRRKLVQYAQSLKAADTDNSGEIDYTEFIAATIDTNIYLRDDYLQSAFQMFDKDGSGKIDNEEVVALLQGEDLKNLVTKEAIGAAM